MIDDTVSLLPAQVKSIKEFIFKIQNLEQVKKAAAEDISGIYEEAKATGLNTKALKATVRRLAKNQDELDFEENLVNSYVAAATSS